MAFLADTHVHIYPHHNLRDALVGGLTRLLELENVALERTPALQGVNLAKILCLTERPTESVFVRLQEEGHESCIVLKTEEPYSLRLEFPDLGRCYLFSGRQLVTKERLEVLGLGLTGFPHRPLSLIETVLFVRDQGGIPVVPWSPGKWLFGRGRLIRELLAEASPGNFFIGDIRLRPRELPEPWLMRLARAEGFQVLCGSDPLPLLGQEAMIGSYASLSAKGRISEVQPFYDFSQILHAQSKGQENGLSAMGKRGNVFSLLATQLRLQIEARG